MNTAKHSNPRSQPFGYNCHRCCQCCYHKEIQVNPYEVARLAANLGQTTTEFRATWTRDNAGTTLKQTETGACVFLGQEGCTVHADRPLACRLYPLGRFLLPEGTESFVPIEPAPHSAGEFTAEGTIATFLESQEVEPFIKASDEYYHWICAAEEVLDRELALNLSEQDNENSAAAKDLLDIDTALSRYCTSTGSFAPTDIEQRKQLHLTILYGELTSHEGGQDGRPKRTQAGCHRDADQ
jgi:uncharacterized protein